MTTIRRRLTIWYTVALGVSVFAFGAALYVERRQSSFRELDQRLALEAEFAQRWLVESRRVLNGPLVVSDPRPALRSSIGAYFEGVRDYLVIVDREGRILFLSEAARTLNFAGIERLSSQLQPIPVARRFGTLNFGGGIDPVRVLALPIPDAGPELGGMLVATSVNGVSFGPAALLRSMLFIAPVILLGSVGLGYWLAGTSLRPVQGIMDEVDAISDGRSLHRRVAVPLSGDEMARLATTVNQMLTRLEQSFGSLRRFTADASHELKTPLMVLRAGVERALTDPRTPTEVMQSLDETLEQVNRMSELVENLLTLARADEGRAPLAVAECDLRELVAEASETAGMLAEGAGVTVYTEIPDAPIRVEVDRQRIRELLLNLITNAIKYTPVGGEIGLSLLEADGEVRIAVRDTGIGIAAGDLPHIFDRFWRADPARSRSGERPGTGLGLAITKWIADAHGGSISVQSRPGRGTRFIVTLPAHTRERVGDEDHAAPSGGRLSVD